MNNGNILKPRRAKTHTQKAGHDAGIADRENAADLKYERKKASHFK
jgi:hypothetical protein